MSSSPGPQKQLYLPMLPAFGVYREPRRKRRRRVRSIRTLLKFLAQESADHGNRVPGQEGLHDVERNVAEGIVAPTGGPYQRGCKAEPTVSSDENHLIWC